MPRKVIELSQADVDAVPQLPLRLAEPDTVYRLVGDITVGFRPEFRHLDVIAARSIFAVLAIEADGVELDLNGHTVSMVDEVADLVLEGASLIELGNTPYPDGVFPETFKDPHVGAKNVVVRNGALVSSGHFGVHGVGNSHVVLEDLAFDRMGVGAITLSQFGTDLTIRSCRINGTTAALRASLDDLTELEMDRAKGEVFKRNQFKPKSIVPDGSLITGIHVNGQFNVKQQPHALPEAEHGTAILIEGCTIANIVGKTNDYGALLESDSRKVITTETGAIVHAAAVCPHLTALGEAQLKALEMLPPPPKSDVAARTRMGLDVRGHHLKGVHGIRLVCVADATVRNNRIEHVVNMAEHVGGRCVTGTAAGIAIRACAKIALEGNTIDGVAMRVDPTRAMPILSE